MPLIAEVKGLYHSITSGSLFSRAISERRLQVQSDVCPSLPHHSPSIPQGTHNPVTYTIQKFQNTVSLGPYTHRVRRFFSIFLQFNLSSFCRESSRLHQWPPRPTHWRQSGAQAIAIAHRSESRKWCVGFMAHGSRQKRSEEKSSKEISLHL